jgi:lipopolysaccharide export system protein LptC
MALAPDLPTGLSAPSRARSFAAARSHSRVVKFLKVAIPAGSLLAVAIPFAWSALNPFARIPGLTVGPITVSGSKIAMESPRLTGFRKDNRPYEVTATAAYQDIRKPNVIELKDMKAKLAVNDSGSTAHLVSRTGFFDTGKEHLDLKDEIKVWTDKGEEVHLKSASVDFKTGSGTSREPVRITTPSLTLDAQGMELADNGQRITFTGGVKTVLKRENEGTRTSSVKAGVAPAKVN